MRDVDCRSACELSGISIQRNATEATTSSILAFLSIVLAVLFAAFIRMPYVACVAFY